MLKIYLVHQKCCYIDWLALEKKDGFQKCKIYSHTETSLIYVYVITATFIDVIVITLACTRNVILMIYTNIMDIFGSQDNLDIIFMYF